MTARAAKMLGDRRGDRRGIVLPPKIEDRESAGLASCDGNLGIKTMTRRDCNDSFHLQTPRVLSDEPSPLRKFGALCAQIGGVFPKIWVRRSIVNWERQATG